jgi:sugar phosphate isomerase/epimerase
MPTRRDALRQAALLAALAGCGRLRAGAPRAEEARYRIGACDWSLRRRTDPASFELGARLGLHGIQVDLGDDPSAFLDPARRRPFEQAARDHGLAIAGLALGVLNRVPYKSDPRTEAWVSDAVDVARALGTRVILLAFFERGDLKNDAEGQREVVQRLRRVAPKAERAGVVLGIESWLSGAEHRALVEAVGSPNVRVYYDVANSERMGYDVYREIRDLGRDLVCEVHAKENGHLLGRGRIDFRRVRAALDDIGFRGWLQIEGSVPPGADLIESYRANAAFLRDVFLA